MILQLRHRHRSMVLVAALIAPLVLVVALAARAPDVRDAVSASDGNIPPPGAVFVGDQAIEVGAATLNLGLFQHTGENVWYVTTGAVNNRESVGPDVLVYWQTQAATARLDSAAQLLGPLRPARDSTLPLPFGATGYIVFYSLAHQKVISAVALKTLLEES